MSKLLETWASGLKRLQEQRQPAAAEDGRREKGRIEEILSEKQEQKPFTRSTLSEVTVCLLMDRFSPC